MDKTFNIKNALKNKTLIMEKVVSVEHLAELAETKRSVFVDQYLAQRRFPAVVVMNWQCQLVIRLIRTNKIYIYPRGENK